MWNFMGIFVKIIGHVGIDRVKKKLPLKSTQLIIFLKILHKL